MNPEDAHIQKTHSAICKELVGQVEWIESGKFSRIGLTTNHKMRVDEKGLIHGGFTFGLADYAAMIAVNEPNVVLLSSSVKFLKPVRLGEQLTARARIVESEGRKKKVWSEVLNQEQQKVLEGEFLCLVLEKHVLEK